MIKTLGLLIEEHKNGTLNGIPTLSKTVFNDLVYLIATKREYIGTEIKCLGYKNMLRFDFEEDCHVYSMPEIDIIGHNGMEHKLYIHEGIKPGYYSKFEITAYMSDDTIEKSGVVNMGSAHLYIHMKHTDGLTSTFSPKRLVDFNPGQYSFARVVEFYVSENKKPMFYTEGGDLRKKVVGSEMVLIITCTEN